MKKKIAKKPVRKHSKSKPAAAVPAGKLTPIRRKLLEMRDDLIKTVHNQQITGDSQETGDPADQASQSIEKEIMFELTDVERNTLDQIEAALRKLDKGAYGMCESCRKPISKPRLGALPFARYCIVCQSSSEKAPELVEQVQDFRGLSEES